LQSDFAQKETNSSFFPFDLILKKNESEYATKGFWDKVRLKSNYCLSISEETERIQSTKLLVKSFSQHRCSALMFFSLDRTVTKHQILHIKYPPKIL
jgi:hypothetical protein